MCISVYLWSSRSPSPKFEWPQETADYRYALPIAADIIEGKADVADLFGDYSMCASFTLPEAELQSLRQEGLNWFPAVRKDYISKSDWYVGTLMPNQIKDVSFMLDEKPDANATYSYISEDVEGGWWRAVAINEDSKIVYYCRVSW